MESSWTRHIDKTFSLIWANMQPLFLLSSRIFFSIPMHRQEPTVRLVPLLSALPLNIKFCSKIASVINTHFLSTSWPPILSLAPSLYIYISLLRSIILIALSLQLYTSQPHNTHQRSRCHSQHLSPRSPQPQLFYMEQAGPFKHIKTSWRRYVIKRNMITRRDVVLLGRSFWLWGLEMLKVRHFA